MFERTIKGAREAADAGQIDEWVHAFLSTGLGANPPMAVGLRKQQRWWIGPVAVPIASVTRICGPEAGMEYRTTREAWEARVAAIMAVEPEQLPPVILEYRGPALLGLCDGSHRHEAIRRRGRENIWALVWCNTESDFVSAQRIYGRTLDGLAVRWELWRQDDNGNRVLVRAFADRNEAKVELERFESLQHKQIYWLVRFRIRGSDPTTG